MTDRQPKFPRCADAIAALIAARGLRNVSVLSVAIGVENSVVSRWARGDTRPHGANLGKLLKYAATRPAVKGFAADLLADDGSAPAVDDSPAPTGEPSAA